MLLFLHKTKPAIKNMLGGVMKVPRKRLSTKVMTETFMSFNTVIYKESLTNRINYLCGLSGVEVIIKR